MGARNWSSSASANTSVGGINIGEGAARANMNDSQRAIMAALKPIVDGVPVSIGEHGAPGTFGSTASAQTAFGNALNAVEGVSGTLKLGYGQYNVDQILLPADNSTDTRGEPMQMIGVGNGEPFVVGSTRRGSVIVGQDATKAAIKTRVKSGGSAGESAGTQYYSGFRVEHTGNSGVPAVDLATFYGPSTMTRVDIYQAGDGDGLHVGYMATGKIEMGYILGKKWGDGVGAVGRGLWLKAAIDAGLQSIQKVTSRGFQIGFQLGETSGGQLLSASLVDCEVSYCDFGVIVSATSKAAGIDRLYIEGSSNIYGVIDAGYATRISNIYAEISFDVGVQFTGKGSGIAGGYMAMRPAGATAAQITNTVENYGAYVHETYFRWSGVGGTNVIGIDIQAQADPLVSVVGNAFEPTGEWVGSGCQKIKDSTYSSAHGGSGSARGSGVFGLMQRESGNFRMMPALSRGAINLHVDEDTRVDADVSSNVLALTAASVQQVTFSSAQSISRFTAINLPDKTGKLYFTNGNVTLTAGTYINGIARDIKLPSGRKAWVEYQVLPTSDAPVSITNIQLADTSFTVAQLADLKGDFSQTIFASNGRRSGEGVGAGTGCPVWWDGTNWKTFYDNSTVAA